MEKYKNTKICYTSYGPFKRSLSVSTANSHFRVFMASRAAFSASRSLNDDCFAISFTLFKLKRGIFFCFFCFFPL
ncbi:MAG: hypothetical protein Ct9H300mP3_05410 [Gammaproteobacteria bacterium]|nr:MAG: hypothetical protein Ct9H300mP3_05410 [Gammaproteobacteria bacterium]